MATTFHVSYASVDEYRASVHSERPDAAIQAALDGAQADIHARTGRRFDSTWRARTFPVRHGVVLLPDLIAASGTKWAHACNTALDDIDIVLDDERPHRRATLIPIFGWLKVSGLWGFNPTPPAIVRAEIGLAAGVLGDDFGAGTGTPAATIRAYADTRALTATAGART